MVEGTPCPDRAVEAALRRRVVRVALAASCVAASVLVLAGSAGAAIPYTAYVGNEGSGSLSSIDTATDLLGSTIASPHPSSVAITPDGQTAWVTNYLSEGTVTPINLSTGIPGTPIAVGTEPSEIAITPDGSDAYVTNTRSNSVTPINLLTRTAGAAIPVGEEPVGIAITPDGATAYVANYRSKTVTPITLATNSAGSAIPVEAEPIGVAVTPDGRTAYVANWGSGKVTPIAVATNTPGGPITVGEGPLKIAITPDGATAYVTNEKSNNVTPIKVATNTPGAPIPVGEVPIGIAITPDQATAYVTNSTSNTVTPINLSNNTPGAPISVGTFPDAVVVAPDQAPTASFTATTGPTGAPTSFNASASIVPYGTITSYAWNFGDGTTAVSSTPTTTHTYAAAGNYTVTLTETDAAGTSTIQVFTGQTVSRNGGPGAQTARTLQITAPHRPGGSPAVRPARLVISVRSVKVNKRGEVLIPVRCPVSARDGCKGTIKIRLGEPARRQVSAHAARCGRGCRPIGSAHYEARAGHRLEVHVHIASYARELLRRRKAMRVTLIATSVLGRQIETLVRVITLRA